MRDASGSGPVDAWGPGPAQDIARWSGPRMALLCGPERSAGRAPLVETMWTPNLRSFQATGRRASGVGSQAQSTRVSGVYIGPPVALLLSLNSA